MTKIVLEPIGVVNSPRKDLTDDHWGEVIATIDLNPKKVTEESILGLKDFSHIEVIFYFHKVPDESIVMTAAHPRENPKWPRVGIFAQRKKSRPNKLGVTICKLISVKGLKVTVKALDAIDGTPVLDIKPHVREFMPKEVDVTQPGWQTELMKNYF
jgi:tRNA (adenine37-N6)-methyltransferase